jgi:hypothetical protein
VFDEEDGNAVVGSPRVEQHISLVMCRFHHKSSQNDQADRATLRLSCGARSAFKLNKIFLKTRYRAITGGHYWARRMFSETNQQFIR